MSTAADELPKCHYEVLGLSLTANDNDIKQAHRKLALKWHPDRQIGNEEEATAVYRRIQEAYEVLSNPQERSWYDSHREVILRGKEDALGINVARYFNSSCYRGMNDTTVGFFTIYNEVFQKIAELEGAVSAEYNVAGGKNQNDKKIKIDKNNGKNTNGEKIDKKNQFSKNTNNVPEPIKKTPSSSNYDPDDIDDDMSTPTTSTYDPDDIDDDMSTPSRSYNDIDDIDDIDDDYVSTKTSNNNNSNKNDSKNDSENDSKNDSKNFNQQQQQQSQRTRKQRTVPSFGTSTTSGVALKGFYHYWLSFTTVRTFSWCDKYTGEGEGRRMRRLVDAENEKLRQKGRSDFNSLIRGLVRQVQRQDPRWRKYVQDEALLAQEREKQREIEIRDKELKKKLQRQELRVQQQEQMMEDWLAYKEQYGSDVEDDYFGDMGNNNDGSDEDGPQLIIYECELCSKRFKSDKMFLEHEKNKKHRDNVKKWEKQHKLNYPTANELLKRIHAHIDQEGIVVMKNNQNNKFGQRNVGECNSSKEDLDEITKNVENLNLDEKKNQENGAENVSLSPKERLRQQLLQEEAMMMGGNLDHLAPIPPPPTKGNNKGKGSNVKNDKNNNSNEKNQKNNGNNQKNINLNKSPQPSPLPPSPITKPNNKNTQSLDQSVQGTQQQQQSRIQVNKPNFNKQNPNFEDLDSDEDDEDYDEDEDDEDYEEEDDDVALEDMTNEWFKEQTRKLSVLPKKEQIARIKELQVLKSARDMMLEKQKNMTGNGKVQKQQEQGKNQQKKGKNTPKVESSDDDDDDDSDDDDAFLSFGAKKAQVSSDDDDDEEDEDDEDEDDEDDDQDDGDDEDYDDEDDDDEDDEDDESNLESDGISTSPQLTKRQIEALKLQRKRENQAKKLQKKTKKVQKARIAQNKAKYGLNLSNKEKKALETQKQQVNQGKRK